ncbi:MAG: hypothetical protein QG610_2282 [Euryarchaeota archaeon]|nr:hypothetical protein [Euryarchaeota archaeon]
MRVDQPGQRNQIQSLVSQEFGLLNRISLAILTNSFLHQQCTFLTSYLKDYQMSVVLLTLRADYFVPLL